MRRERKQGPVVARHRLFLWIVKTRQLHGVETIAEALSCEGLAYEDVPAEHYDAMVAFRHKNQQQRRAAIRAFLDGRS